MLLIIDNFDSFVFNVARYCAELGHDSEVVRNNGISIADIAALRPTSIVISPGPCSPMQAGISLETIRVFSGQIPLLGICLGHQCLGAAFGATIERARVPMHGRASPIRHSGHGLFGGLPTPLQVARYHSLIVTPKKETLEHLRVEATSPEGEVMALAHRSAPTFGVQFHPESILSEHGHGLLANFFAIAQRWHHDNLA